VASRADLGHEPSLCQQAEVVVRLLTAEAELGREAGGRCRLDGELVEDGGTGGIEGDGRRRRVFEDGDVSCHGAKLGP
jgi:hypothetical protein